MSVLVFCKIENGKITKNGLKAIAAAQTFEQPITCLGFNAESIENFELPSFTYLQEAYVISDTNSPEACVQAIIDLHQQNQFSAIIASNHTLSKQVLPQVAALCDTDMFTDVTAIIDRQTIKRPMYAGDFIATVETKQDLLIMSIRASAFAEPILSSNSDNIQAELLEPTTETKVKFTTNQNAQPKLDLTTADIVITGGRGLGEAKNFALIEQLAEKLNAAVGATRATVDAGWVDNALQVGQTGKVIAPKLYIGIGLSGAIQHLAGIKDAENIMAINTDANAPIMQFADYAYEGDLFEVVPALLNNLKDTAS